MKRMKMAMAMIVFACILSSCSQTKDFGNAQMEAKGSTTETSEGKIQAVFDEAETESYDYDADAELEHLTGEYDYLSDYGTGKLTVEKTSYGYDISDYE